MAIPILKLRNKATGKWNGVPVLIGEPAKLISQTTEYQLSDSGITPPSGDWLSEPPATVPGEYLWERITQNWNKGDPKILYLPIYQGKDGYGRGVIKKLWTNPDPDSAFPQQKITVENPELYAYYIVNAWGGAGVCVLPGIERGQIMRTSKGAVTFRFTTWEIDGVSFGDGNICSPYGEAHGDDSQCVPMNIWGVTK